MAMFDITIIGGGPAGLAAAIAAGKSGKNVLLIEREARLGGILKQCIHDGFGLTRFKEKLSGPEYAEREIEMLANLDVTVDLLTFVTKIEKNEQGFRIKYVSRLGMGEVLTSKLILATGCRERTAKQVAIHGTNPAGVFTAGSAQHYMNILGQMPTKRCLILGSGDIGLIMARRITLEGGIVLGVYEIKPTPSGLTRNLVQCLDDFSIPLYLSHTVTRVFGEDRLTGVEVARVNDRMQPMMETAKRIDCDALILSVGLIPENEIAESLSVPINPRTKGPFVDQTMATLVEGIYSCGNSLHVSDVADMVSETGEIAAMSAVNNQKQQQNLVEISAGQEFLYVVPSHIDTCKKLEKIVMYFRVNACGENKRLLIKVDGQLIQQQRYRHVRPPEMERIVLDLSAHASMNSLTMELEDAS